MPSIERARKSAQEAGLGNRITFDMAGGQDMLGEGLRLCDVSPIVSTTWAIRLGAARHVRQALKDDGTVMLVEPFAGDRIEDNLSPVGRVYYGFSTVICTPPSLSQEVGLALGSQASEQRLRKVMADGGFSRFRRETSTPFNLELEARP